MTARNPLVLVGGQVQELPAGDTINGASSGGSSSSFLVGDGRYSDYLSSSDDFKQIGTDWYQVGGIYKPYNATYHDLANLPNSCKDYSTLYASGQSTLAGNNGGLQGGSIIYDSANSRWVKLIPGATSNQIGVSTNDGATWTWYTISAHAYYSLGFNPTSGKWVALNGTGTTAGQATSTDPAGTWTRTTTNGANVQTTSNQSKIVASGSTNLVAHSVVSGSGPYYSTDGGTTWAASTGVSSQLAPGDICVTSNGTVLIKTATSDVIYRSTNNGVSFSSVSLPGGYGVAQICAIAADTSGNVLMLCSVAQGYKTAAFYSSDNGATWAVNTDTVFNVYPLSTNAGNNLLWDGTNFVAMTSGRYSTILVKMDATGIVVDKYALGQGSDTPLAAVTYNGMGSIAYGNGYYIGNACVNGYFFRYQKSVNGNPGIYFPTDTITSTFSTMRNRTFWRTK